MLLEPFEFQSEASDLGLQAALSGENFLIVSPTGTGKSVILCDLYRKLLTVGMHAAIITSRDMIRTGILNDGQAMGLNRSNLSADVLNSIVFRNRMRKNIESGGRRAPDILLVDEAHHLLARSWSEPLLRNRQMRLIGTTATPMRGDPSETPQWRCFYDRFHEAISYVEAMLQKVLVEFHVDREALGLLSTGGGVEGQSENDLKQATEVIVDQKLGDVFDLVMGCERVENRPTLIAAPSYESAVKIATFFTHAGQKTEVVSDKVRNKQRDLQFARSRNNECWLVGVEIILEGINMPWMSRGVCLRRSGALNPYAQFIGRMLRVLRDKDHTPRFDLKPDAQLIDCTDNFPRFRARMRDSLGLEFRKGSHVWYPDLTKEPERAGLAVARDYVMYRFAPTPSPSKVTGMLGGVPVQVEMGVAVDGDQWAGRIRGGGTCEGTWVLQDRGWTRKTAPMTPANYSVTIGGDQTLARGMLARVARGVIPVSAGEVTVSHLLACTLLQKLNADGREDDAEGTTAISRELSMAQRVIEAVPSPKTVRGMAYKNREK